MRFFSLVIVIALLSSIVAGVSVGVFNMFEGNALYRDQIYKQLLSVAESKTERVDSFINNRKSDIEFLVEMEDLSNIFDKGLVYDVELMQDKIRGISNKTARDIEKYLLKYPNMTLKDLQNDEVFQKLAVRDVGETGYTYVNSMKEGVLYFHPNSKVIGKTYHVWKNIFPDIWKYNDEIAQSDPCMDSYGFYNWEDINGEIRGKFTYHSCINGQTSDGYSFYVGSSTYIDEYGGSIQLAKDLDLELRDFKNEKIYSDLILINLYGDVVWSAEKNNELGTNIITGIYNNSSLSSIFKETKRNLGVTISESEYYNVDGKLKLFIASPVFDVDKETLKGIMVLVLDNKKISELITDNIGLGEDGEVYIVDRAGRHIASLNFEKFKFFEDTNDIINSEHVEKCFEDSDNYYANLRGENINKIKRFGTYLSYNKSIGMVFGAHSYILDPNWCILVEMDNEDFLKFVPNMKKIFIIVIGFSLFLLFLFLLFLNNLFDIKKEVINET